MATTWYQAHIVAVGLLMLAVARRRSALGATDARATTPARTPASVTRRGAALAIDRTGFGIGLLFGLAVTARLTVVFAAPFFMLVGPGRRLVATELVGRPRARPSRSRPCCCTTSPTTGHVFHPAYDHLYQLEARAYTGLGYHPEWAAEDPRYLPQNLAIMLLSAPEILPDRLRDTLGTIDLPLCTDPAPTRGLFDVGLSRWPCRATSG